jgi:hypothetical protein
VEAMAALACGELLPGEFQRDAMLVKSNTNPMKPH